MNADWHPDPLGRAQFRYYDGSAWTHHVATNGQQGLEPDTLPLTPPLSTAPPIGVPMQMPYPAGPSVPMWATAPRRKGGRLIAAGVLAIISGAITLLISIGYFASLSLPSCSDAAPGVNCRDATLDDSSLFKALMVLTFVMAALLLASGIGGCMRRSWGQRMLIATAGAVAILDVVVMAYKFSPATVVNVGWCALVIGLALANKRADYELPR